MCSSPSRDNKGLAVVVLVKISVVSSFSSCIRIGLKLDSHIKSGLNAGGRSDISARLVRNDLERRIELDSSLVHVKRDRAIGCSKYSFTGNEASSVSLSSSEFQEIEGKASSIPSTVATKLEYKSGKQNDVSCALGTCLDFSVRGLFNDRSNASVAGPVIASVILRLLHMLWFCGS